jgi:hypothetical protein
MMVGNFFMVISSVAKSLILAGGASFQAGTNGFQEV